MKDQAQYKKYMNLANWPPMLDRYIYKMAMHVNMTNADDHMDNKIAWQCVVNIPYLS